MIYFFNQFSQSQHGLRLNHHEKHSKNSLTNFNGTTNCKNGSVSNQFSLPK